ncbi:MAG TPA: FtsX-like permease family protein [Acidobacteriaceae bacterium]|nr:FtsX-like permease family protein [Acidobacteriaceae bacterium]
MIVDPLQKDLTAAVRPALFAVLGAVFLVMLIACVNVANLLLARGVQRRAEFALRAALGAARTRVVRQLLTETILLATIGGILGIAVAAAALRALIALSPPGLPQVHAMTIDPAALLFALATAAIIGIILGLVPAFQLSREDLSTGMRQGSRATPGTRQWARRALVVSEISLAAILLVGTGLLLRSMEHLFAVDPGFDPTHVLTMQVQTSGRRFDTDAARVRFFAAALDRVRQLPGVVSAGFTTQLPLSGDSDIYGIELQGETTAQQTPALRYAVTPGYVEAMRIPLLRGRLLNDHDIAGAPPAILVNQAFADARFPGQSPIGHLVRTSPDVGTASNPWATIVGVVGNVKQASLSVGGEQAFYISTAQWAWTDAAQTLVLRTRDDPASLAPAVREAIWSVDKDQPIVQVATMDTLVAASEVQRHFVLMLFEAFALAGLLLAAIGIYGVLAGSVNERTREIGVRAALGASRRSILTLIVRQGMAPVALGLFLGLTVAVLASQALAAFLFDTSRFDVLTYAAVTALLLSVSGAACLIPGRRATTINPVDALRAE